MSNLPNVSTRPFPLRLLTAALLTAGALALVGCSAESAPSGDGAAAGDSAAAEAGTESGTDSGTVSADGTVYGKPLTDVPTVAVSELIDNIDNYAGKQVRVEGMITDVCAKRGCWMKVAGDREFETVTFKVQDGVIVFPMSDRGRHAVADGVARKVEMNLEKTKKFLAHKAEESGKEFDPATVTEPLSMVRLDGIGAVVSDAK